MAPVLGRKRRAVQAPDHFVLDVRAFAMAHRLKDWRVLRRVRRAVGTRVVYQLMHLTPGQLFRLAAEETRAGAVREDADAAQIDAVDGLGRRIEQEPDALLALD